MIGQKTHSAYSKLYRVTERVKSKTRMQIIGALWESDNISVFWEKKEENECQIFVLKFVLGTLAYVLEKASNLPSFHFVCLSYDITLALRYSNLLGLRLFCVSHLNYNVAFMFKWYGKYDSLIIRSLIWSHLRIWSHCFDLKLIMVITSKQKFQTLFIV